MGYTTDFNGRFELDKPLTVSHLTTLKDFADERHDEEGFPSIWCQWQPTVDGKGIEWDGGEKFYEYTDWLAYLIEKFLEPWGYVLNGEVTWQGEDPDDIGMLRVVNNDVSEVDGQKVYEPHEGHDPHLQADTPDKPEDPAKLLTALPRTLVGDGGSPNIFFVTDCNTAEVIAIFIGDDERLEEAAINLANRYAKPVMVEDRLTGVVHDNPHAEAIQRAGDDDE